MKFTALTDIIATLRSEAGAAFDAATLEDLLTGLRIIALHEAVFDFALALMWLISSLWHIIILSILTNSCSSIP